MKCLRCTRKAKCRGLCGSHYNTIIKRIASGEMTDEAAINDGLIRRRKGEKAMPKADVITDANYALIAFREASAQMDAMISTLISENAALRVKLDSIREAFDKL